MSDPQTIPQTGTFCHVEIPAADTEASKKFYGDVFGWQFQDIPEMDYTVYTTRDGAIGGGMMKKCDEYPQQMVNYIACEDIPGTLDKIKAGGGAVIHEEMPVGEMGWMAWASDPDGNVFALWKNNPNMPCS